LFKLDPETAATEHELFRKMNGSEEFKREMLKGAMALQHGTISPLHVGAKCVRFHAILSGSERSPSSCCKLVDRIYQYNIGQYPVSRLTKLK